MGFWVTLILYVAMAVLSDLLRPKPDIENAKPAQLGDFRFPTATEGRPVPKLWGRVRIDGLNVVWTGDLLQEAITEKIKTGFFSSEKIIKGFRYHLGFQFAFCLRVHRMLRLWIGSDIVLDTPLEHGDTFTINEPELFGGEDLGNGGIVGTFQFFSGTTDQDRSDYLVSQTGVRTPAYRGIAYIAPFEERVYFGTSTSVKPWKAELEYLPNGLALTDGRESIDGSSNPANVIFELLTDAEDGWGEPESAIDFDVFRAAGNTLFSEGNGFDFLLDRVEDLGATLKRVEDQIDGVVYKSPFDGLWKLRLIRADYNVDTIPEINDTNILEIVSFTRGTWEGTTNQVRVPFSDSEDDYKESYGFAQDMAGVRVLGMNVSTTISHPGVKRRNLANAIAWRELRTLATPLALATFIVDRSMYGVLPGDVVAFTDPDLDFVRLPMRVRSVDYGDLLDGKITLDCVQDVFFAAAGSFAPPPPTLWTPPAATLSAYPVDEQLAFEAPRAFTLRDPETLSPTTDKVWAAARRQGSEVTFQMWERHSAGSPSGAFALFGDVFGFMRIGELSGSLSVSASNPVSSVTIVPDPDTQAAINSSFPTVPSLSDLGVDLLTLCLVGDEFILVQSAQTSGANVQLNNVYRGVLDSVQRAHAAGTKVYLIFIAGGMSDSTIASGQNVEVKLQPRAIGAELDLSLATAVSFTMSDRTRRPYPPSSFRLNSVELDSTNVDLDSSGAGEDVGVLFDEVRRRDFRAVDEIASILNDAADLAADFPAENSTTVEIAVFNGSTQLAIVTGISGTSGTVRQLDILQGLGTTSLPASLTFSARQSHTLGGVIYKSRYWLDVVATIDSDMVGEHAFGVLDQSDVSTVYEVQTGDDTTDHAFTLSTAFTSGNVEYRLDGGSWTTLITAGGTSGSIPNAGLSVGTDIEVRHGSTDVAPQKLMRMTVGGSVRAYGVLVS